MAIPGDVGVMVSCMYGTRGLHDFDYAIKPNDSYADVITHVTQAD